jgi:hypothetical protein
MGEEKEKKKAQRSQHTEQYRVYRREEGTSNDIIYAA